MSPPPVVGPIPELVAGGQLLERAVEPCGALQRLEVADVDVAHRGGLRDGDVERAGLAVVVAEHLGRDVVGHRGEQGVPLLGGEVAVAHDAVEQDLDVDLVVGAVHPGRVVDRVGVDVAAVAARTRCGRAG